MTLIEVPARATIRPALGGSPISNSDRDGFEMPSHASRAVQKYWGTQCGRCESRNTVTEEYPKNEGGREFWCLTCGTELGALGLQLYPGGRDAKSC